MSAKSKYDLVQTFNMPLVIKYSAARDSYRGYNTTEMAEQNVQIIPMTTHAVRPPTPYIVCAKNRGRGTMMSMISVYGCHAVSQPH